MSMRRGPGLLLLLLATAGCCSTCGDPCGSCGPWVCVESCKYCRCLDDLHTGTAARRCALEALHCRDDVSCDYAHGFVQAHVDLAQGATGTLPPVPPERYWSVCFRSCPGHVRAQEWYRGYADGVASAGGGMGAPCQHIPSSGTVYDSGPAYGHNPSRGGAFPCGYRPGGW
jgi:hypothetical protein